MSRQAQPASSSARFTLHDDDELGQFVELDESADYHATSHPASSPAPSAPVVTRRSARPDASSGAMGPESQSALLRKLAARYPSLDAGALKSLLTACDNDIDAVSALVDADTSVSSAGDAALAASLQERENRAVARARRHRRNGASFALDQTQMDNLVSTLRDIVVPALQAHFEELILPDTNDETASIAYSLKHLQVTGLSLPKVTVRPALDRKFVFVNVLNAQLELHLGQWRYQSQGIVPLQDQGQARLSVQGLNILLKLQPRWSFDGGANVVVSDCHVTVDGVVRFKTYGAGATWAYNAVAVVLKPLVLSYVKEAIADTVTRSLTLYLREWSCSSPIDTSHASATTTTPQAPVTAAE
ncbi:Lipid-binding serum glycoprotein [Gracilaria domingensis]|nr:Lipid-binding serum glycoprotein [Gracilaria domingensis]